MSAGGSAPPPKMRDIEVVAPNLKQRLSGVTSTIIQLVPLMQQKIGIATIGAGLPDSLPKIRWWQLPGLWVRPASGRKRIWHARRNTEMAAGLLLRTLGAPLHLVFTSASQRQHRRWTKFLIRRMDAVIATSRKTAAYLEVPNTVVMHGIDMDRFSPPTDRRAAVEELGLDADQLYVGCFGRIRHQKGTDLFVDAMIALLPHYPGWSAIVAGRATAEHQGFEQELMVRVEAAGLTDRILFVGEHADIFRWYRALSLFVAPQRWEGFGLTPLEAMATGMPVVAADVGAFSELIEDGRIGKIVPAGNVQAMAEAIKPYLAEPAVALEEGSRALAHVRESFPPDREVTDILSVYGNVWAKAG
jgi:mannosyltransferase